MKLKVLLFNPPGKILIRGEGRSDSETDPLTSPAAAKWIYPPMNLAYGAACLRTNGFEPIIRDYPAERKTLEEFEADIIKLAPDICVTNMNPSSEAQDLTAIQIVRKNFPRGKVVACAPYLALYDSPEVSVEMVKHFDAILIAEHPENLVPLLEALSRNNNEQLKSVEGLLYWDDKTSLLIKTKYPMPGSLENLPLPARDLLNNSLYVRPDNGRPQALIQTGRGCPSNCAFCLVPPLTGKVFTLRPVDSVIEEIRDCLDNHGIEQFFFRADTFSINKTWTMEFCQKIIDSGLKISWCANSRANTVDDDLIVLMRKSGCWLLAFGFESGCPETLRRIRKGNTVADNEKARRICLEHGIKVHGQYIIGFSWEGKEEIEQTFEHIRRMRCDFIDVQILVPYKGTVIYAEMKKECPALMEKALGSKMQGGVSGTAKGLTKADLIKYQRQMLRATYLSLPALLRRVGGIRSFAELKNYTRYGIKFVTNQFFTKTISK